MKRAIVQAIFRFVISLLKLNAGGKLQTLFLAGIFPVFPFRLGSEYLLIHCPNEIIRWRIKTLLSKEPETIQWINTFDSADTLLDVGANIGIYSLYAAQRGHRVLAIEPESQNFAEINRNIQLNNFGDRIQSYCVALGKNNGLGILTLSSLVPGSALHTIRNIDERHDPPEYEQGVVLQTIDSFLYQTKDFRPSHIKIDVDGEELGVVHGAMQTLQQPFLKSVLIEIDEKSMESEKILDVLKTQGFSLVSKSRSPLMDVAAKQTSVYNYLFVRKQSNA